MMDVIDFFNLVSVMRTAQKMYFKKRTQSNLLRAKKLESEVDDAIKNVMTASAGSIQLPLTEDRQLELICGDEQPNEEA